MSTDGRVWHVRSYPSGRSLYQADTYEECQEWQAFNDMVSVIVPEWPEGTS